MTGHRLAEAAISGVSGSTLDDIRCRPTISIAETAQVLHIGLNQTYAAARAGEIPILRLGRTYRVPVPALLALLGETPEHTEAGPSQEPATTVHVLAKELESPHGGTEPAA